MVYYPLESGPGEGAGCSGWQNRPDEKEGFNEEWELQAGKRGKRLLFFVPLCFPYLAEASRSFSIFDEGV